MRGGESGRGGHESEKAGLPFEPGNYTHTATLNQARPEEAKAHTPWKFEKRGGKAVTHSEKRAEWRANSNTRNYFEGEPGVSVSPDQELNPSRMGRSAGDSLLTETALAGV